MVRGTTIFKCHDCGNRFRALDIEWYATVYSTPMRCPKCGSMHTYVPGLLNFGGVFGPGFYRNIWQRMEAELPTNK